MADHLADDPAVVDSFVVERLHLRVRAAAEHVKKLDGYERTVLSRVLNEQVRALQTATTRGLVGRRAPFPGLPSAMVSDKLEVDGFMLGSMTLSGEGNTLAKRWLALKRVVSSSWWSTCRSWCTLAHQEVALTLHKVPDRSGLPSTSQRWSLGRTWAMGQTLVVVE